MYFSNDEIQKAKHTNLAEYLSSKGEELVKNGIRRYKHKTHDSLVFNSNLYYWNSKNEFGNAIDYVVRNMNMDFKEAVKDLCEFNGVYINLTDSNTRTNENNYTFNINNVEMSNNTKRAVAYLTKTRNLDFIMIIGLVKNGLIAQTIKNSNIAFMIKDENNKIVGIEYNTTLSNSKFKGIEKGSDSRYGFNISNCKPGEVKNYFFYESVIDLLSFKQLNKIPDNSILVSMSGLKHIVIDNTIKKFGSGEHTIYIAVDNDPAGKNFCEKLRRKYTGLKFIVPEGAKDWNDRIKKDSIQGKLLNISKISSSKNTIISRNPKLQNIR